MNQLQLHNMNYFWWNTTIAKHLFNSTNAGKDVYLCLSKDEIVELAKIELSNSRESVPNSRESVPNDDAIWKTFISAIKNGMSNDGGKCIVKKAMHSKVNFNMNLSTYPPFIAYLVFFVLPIIENSNDDDINANNYYDRLSSFLRQNDIQETINTSTFSSNKINELWDTLVNWANLFKQESLGRIYLNSFTNNWRYVGKFFSQCVLLPKDFKILPKIFDELGLTPNRTFEKNSFKEKILCNNRGFSPRLIQSLSNNDELSKVILSVIEREYNKWNGETHEEVDNGTMSIKKKDNTIVGLYLQFKININDETIHYTYRLYSTNDFPEDLTCGNHRIIYETNNWSRTIPHGFQESLQLKDENNKWTAKFPERDVRLFISAGSLQLSNDYWIETDTLHRTASMYLMCREDKKNSITEWGNTFSSGNFEEVQYEGLPRDYCLFRFKEPQQGCPSVECLTLYTHKEVNLVGGLLIRHRTYCKQALPEVEISNAEGTERVYLQYKNNREKCIVLSQCPTRKDRWLLPDDMDLNEDFFIKIKDENLQGYELAYTIISSDNASQSIKKNHVLKRDAWGRIITSNEEGTYCIGNDIIQPPSRSMSACAQRWMFFPVPHKIDVSNFGKSWLKKKLKKK